MVLVVQQWVSHKGKAKSLIVFLVHKAGCLCSPNLLLGSWRSPREMLVFSLCWDTKKLVLRMAKEHSSNRSDEHNGESERKQAKSWVSSLGPVLCLPCHQKVWLRLRAGPPASNNMRGSLTAVLSSLGFSLLQLLSTWRTRISHHGLFRVHRGALELYYCFHCLI